jgi:putative glutathione S-transferase
VNIDHIKRGYYSIKALNPNGIVPLGPDLRWMTDGEGATSASIVSPHS